jgi:hypothetical protein
MRKKPLAKPQLFGCANCSPIPSHVLAEDEAWIVTGYIHMLDIVFGYGDKAEGVSLNVDEREDQEEYDWVSVQRVNEFFANQLKEADWIELRHMTPMHDETYEYNKDDGKWYLVEQGHGYA